MSSSPRIPEDALPVRLYEHSDDPIRRANVVIENFDSQSERLRTLSRRLDGMLAKQNPETPGTPPRPE